MSIAIVFTIANSNSAKSNCFLDLIQAQQKVIFQRAAKTKIQELSKGQINAEVSDLNVYMFGRFRTLDSIEDSILNILTPGRYIYDVKGHTGAFRLAQNRQGMVEVVEITSHNDTDPNSVKLVTEALLNRGMPFSRKTKIGSSLDVNLQQPHLFLNRPNRTFEILPEEYEKAGELLVAQTNSGQALKNGTYVYITYFDTRNAEYFTVTSPAYLPAGTSAGNEKFYVGHRSLDRKFYREGLEVVAAGEYAIRHGLFSRINNQSGTFRGGPGQLEHAAETFRAAGYDIPDSSLVDFAELRRKYPNNPDLREEGAHATALTKAKNMHKINSDPKYAEVYQEASLMLLRLYRLHPDREQVGFINISEFSKKFFEYTEKNKESLNAMMFVVQFLSVAQTDNVATAILNSAKRYMTLDDVLESIKYINDSLPRPR